MLRKKARRGVGRNAHIFDTLEDIVTINEFIKNIAFRHVQPSDQLSDALCNELRAEPYYANAEEFTAFEISNTVLPFEDQERIHALHKLLGVRRMSTLAISAIINYAVSLMSIEHTYTNIGVWNGFTLMSGMICNNDKVCIGIDNFSQFGDPKGAFLTEFRSRRSERHVFYEMDYRQYFNLGSISPIGVYMYDGDHDYIHQRDGLLLAEPFFADGAIIIVDDTNWEGPRRAVYEFISGSRGRHYEIVFDAKTSHEAHPTFWNGVMLLQCS